MKTSIIVALWLAGIVGLAAQTANPAPIGSAQATSLPAPTAWQIASHDANSRVWQRTVYESGPNGQVVPRIHKYDELSSGMYYQDANGQWQESQDEIDAAAQGAVSTKGQYQVIYANNLNSSGAIDLQTPDGKRLRSNILGLVYHDTATGDDVLIGQVQDSTGQLISANQVLYPNAFSGVNADVRYTYKKGSFEQDIILRAQLPTPESVGLNSATTELEVMTEFLNPPQETIKEHAGPKGAEPDQDISWGAMRIGPGKAFDLGEQPSRHSHVTVSKQYVNIQGRKILLEKVPLNNIQTSLQSLPLHASLKPKLPKTASKKLVLPQPLLAQAAGKPMKLAASSPSNQGYVLDYVELNTDQSDFTFQADTTYLVDNSVNLTGTTTFEGETVIKEDQNGQINIDSDGTIVCSTGPYRPAIFTSINDDSIGESGSDTGDSYYTGSPNYVDVLTYLNLSCSSPVLSNMRFCYAQVTVNVPEGIGGICFWDCQFVQIDNAIDTIDTDVNLHNVLFNEIIYDNPIWILSSGNFTAENVTSDGYVDVAANVNILVYVDNPGTQSVALTNCLVTQIDPNNGMYEVSFDGVNFTESSTPTYQTAGAGSYYLAADSPYRNAGTTNITPALLADIATKTTWPPVVYDGVSFSTPTNFSPQAPRDTNSSPDLGYHYDPLDYAFGGCDLYTNLTLTAGTAAGWFEDSGSSGTYGIGLADGAVFTATGTATAPCWITHFDMVQEGNGNWLTHSYLGNLIFNGSGSAPLPQVNAQFTKWSSLTYIGGYFRGNGAGLGQFQDCEFYGAGFTDYGASYSFTNCFFFRTSVVFNYDSLAYQNCTLYNGLLAMARYAGSPVTWLVKNDAFDGTALFTYDELGGDTNYTAIDYNAYNTNNLSWETYPWPYPPIYGTLGIIGANDITNLTTFNWQSSWFGNFYLPPDSPLIDAGSTTADKVGLYEFTTQTNQTEEADSIVDIGYHYVATDAYGNPLETLTNNAPDYLVDANGDGLPDAWEFYWFGNYTNTANELDSSGNTLLYDYQYGLDPNIISFTVNLGSQHFNATNITGSYLVQGGIPSYEAVLVNDTNLNDAVWSNYDGTVYLNLGATDGVYQVSIGLNGFATNATPSWMGTTVYLDRVDPAIIITSPATNVVAEPVIQLQGCAPERLQSVTLDLSNAVIVVTNQPGFLTGRYLDTNVLAYTTNYFQCYDIPLTNGLNDITLHLTDLAGNCSTTNLSVTLDYSTATNPVVCLTWPQDGMQVCQTNFTLRGWVNDPAAQVDATITDTNGDTSVANGVVERTGVLWVENLPLAEGTNLLTLSVTNAAGLSSVTNINIVKSDMTLALTSIDGDLWQPTVNVSGVITDTNAPIWVNGVQGINNGDYTWLATNVPVSSSGVASFDVSTTSLGGSGPDSNTNMDKPSEIVMDSAIWGSASKDVLEYDIEVDQLAGYYTYAGGGVVHDQFQGQYPVTGYIKDTYWDLLPGPGVVFTNAYWFDNEGYSGTYAPGTYSIASEEGSLNVGKQGIFTYQGKNSDVCMVLHTGGKGGSSWQGLSALAATATLELPQPVFTTGGASFLPTQITMDSQTLGSDGIRWKVYPDGSSPDVTPIASAPMYSFTCNDIGYSLSITANGSVLGPDALFYEGQKVSFAITGLPTDGSIANVAYQWGFGQGTYVNAWTNSGPSSSTNYFVDNSLLTNATTYAWWISGGNPEEETIGASCTAYFTNGQSANEPVAGGQIAMYKPPLSIVATDPGQISGDTSYGPYLGQNTLHFGGNYNSNPYGYPLITNGVEFHYNLNGCNLGTNYFTFWRTGTIHREQLAGTGTNYIADSSGLDKALSFGSTNSADFPAETRTAYDLSNNETATGCIELKSNDHFTNYLMFLYQDDPNAIPVPIQSVSWNWGGDVRTNNNWQLISSNYPSFNVNSSPTLPNWNNTIQLDWTSHQP